MAVHYTLTMSKGTYVVSEQMASNVLQAVRSNATDVTIEIDVLGHGQKVSCVTLVVAHVVSLTKHENSECDADFDNVRVLRR